jgi:DNA polymerase III subunit gamma/tau
MTDLTNKYRPLRFGEIAGQTVSVEWMKGQIRSRERRSLLIVGPIGTGKTTSGWIYAKAVLCRTPRDGEPCDACENCVDFGSRGQHSPDFHFFKCGEQSTIEKVQELLEIGRTVPFVADRRVLMLDEAHNLSRRSFQALLNIVEHPPEWVTFILITSEKNEIPKSLLSRLQCQELELLKRTEASRFLRDICDKEAMPFEPAGLNLIFSAIGGFPRVMLRALEKVRDFGPINEINVRSALKLDFDDRLVSYTNALLDGDLGKQLRLMEEWPDTPSRKLAFLHQFFTFNYFNGIRRIERDDPIMRTLPGKVQERLVREFAARSARLALDSEVLWESAIAALEPQDTLTESQLAMILSRFDRLINRGPEPADTVTTPKNRPARPGRLRVQDDHTIAASKANLPWDQVRSFWEVGTFLPQHFGVLFNLRFTLDHKALGIADHNVGANLVSDLTHELGARVAYWAPQSLCHWVYRHEAHAHGGLISRVLLVVPDDQLAQSIKWLTKFLARHVETSEGGLWASRRRKDSAADLAHFHWQGIRALSRCLDPGLRERDERGRLAPLADLLRIPVRWRGPIGNVRTAQGKGASKWLTPTARKKIAAGEMGLLSALNDRAWQYLDRGWELEEHRARLAEMTRRRDAIDQIQLRFAGEDAISVARRTEELHALRASFGSDPKAWPRRWVGWWQTAGLGQKGSTLGHQSRR